MSKKVDFNSFVNVRHFFPDDYISGRIPDRLKNSFKDYLEHEKKLEILKKTKGGLPPKEFVRIVETMAREFFSEFSDETREYFKLLPNSYRSWASYLAQELSKELDVNLD